MVSFGGGQMDRTLVMLDEAQVCNIMFGRFQESLVIILILILIIFLIIFLIVFLIIFLIILSDIPF